MKRAATVLGTAIAVAVAPAAASASAYNTVPCWVWDGSAYHAELQHKPRRCTLGGRFGYQQVDLIRMRWSSWGGSGAAGRGVTVANMGSRARVRVKLYRRVRWEENTFRFTRARFSFDGRGWARRSCFDSTD
jgi:hypothetical protein